MLYTLDLRQGPERPIEDGRKDGQEDASDIHHCEKSCYTPKLDSINCQTSGAQQ